METAISPDVVPTSLQSRKFWMLHRDKKPVNPSKPVTTRKRWSSTQNYTTYTKALELLEQYPGHDGLCMILREEDNLLFIDGDHVRDKSSGEIHSGFTDIVTKLAPDGAWSEVSLSGTGVHVILEGRLPEGYRKGLIELEEGIQIEFFDKKRVCVVTGDLLGDSLDIPTVDPDTLAHLLHERSKTRKKEPRSINPKQSSFDQGWISDLPISIRYTSGGTSDAPNIDPSAWRDSESKNSACHFLDTDTFYDRREDQAWGRVGMFAHEQGIISEPWTDCTGNKFIEVINRAKELGINVPVDKDKYLTSIPTATIPITALGTLSPSEAKRFQSKRGIVAPTTADIRERIGNQVNDSMRKRNRTCIRSPTGTGKTHSIASQKWSEKNSATGDQPVVLLSSTRKARDSAFETGKEQGNEVNKLQGVDEVCPVAMGEFDTEELEKVLGEKPSTWFKKLQQRGLRSWKIHSMLENKLGQCPCRINGICDSEAQYSGGQRDSDGSPRYDLTVACHPHAYSQSMTRDCNVIIDENPVFKMDFDYCSATAIANKKLKTLNVGPNNLDELYQTAVKWPRYTNSEDEKNAPAEYREIKDFIYSGASMDWVVSETESHILAGAIVQACFNAFRKDCVFDVNGIATGEAVHRECQRNSSGEEISINRQQIYVTIEKGEYGLFIQNVWNIPDLSQARSVIVLDATPIPDFVNLLLGDDCKHVSLLTPEEEKNWRVIERRLIVVDVSGGHVRPSATGKYFNPDSEIAIIKKLREMAPLQTAICSKKEEEPLREAMIKAGIEDPKIMTYGAQRSLNDFGNETIGYITGSIDGGDGFINHMCALFGYSATPTRSDKHCDDCNGLGCYKCSHTGKKRDHGRGYEGNSDKARMFLESIRENNVAQAIGRYARPTEEAFTVGYDAGTKYTCVFVRTAAIPEGYTDFTCPGVVWTASELQKKIIGKLDSQNYMSAKEIADELDCTKEHVIKTLSGLDKHVTCWKGKGKYGADLYRLLSNESLIGIVDLSLKDEEGKIVNSNVLSNNYTWSFTISSNQTKLPLDFVSASAMALTDGGETVQMDIEAVGDPPDG